MKKISVDALSLAAVLDYFDDKSLFYSLPPVLQQFVKTLRNNFFNYTLFFSRDRKRKSSRN